MSNEIVKRDMDIDALTKAAEMLAKGNMFPHPSEKRPLNQAEVFSIIEYGRELGMPPVVSLMNIVPVKGRLCTSASCMLGLAVNEGVKYKIQKETDTGCSILFSRNGIDYLSTFNQDDARKAGLLSKDNWRNYPTAMYRARAIAQGCRFVIPDKLAGLYTPEEIGASIVADGDMGNLTATDIHNIEKNNEGKIIKHESPEIVNTVTDNYKIEEEPLATEKQAKAIHAVINAIGMRNMEEIIKDYLYELNILPIDKSFQKIKRKDVNSIITSDNEKLVIKPQLLIDFFSEFKYYDELKVKFASSKKIEKINLLQKMATLIEDLSSLPQEITDKLNDQQMMEYFSLFLMAIHNEEMNRRIPSDERKVTIEEIKRTFNAKDVTSEYKADAEPTYDEGDANGGEFADANEELTFFKGEM